ncbi:MAG: TonB-dependent receptor [Prevotella sp.]|nr:TonB-dependent receptor [Prevotella sp.]
MDLNQLKKTGLKRLLQVVACMLFLMPSGLIAQTGGGITVKGQVTSNGEPLAAVTILVQGTNRYAMTDETGNYSVVVPDANAVIVFSSIGYKTVTETVGSRDIINVALEEDVLQLEQTVVIGYGTQRKEAVTGSVASIGGDAMRSVAATNISQALQGRVAGVEMTQTSTKPGSEMQIRIRGERSLTADNDPIVVLDGIPFAGSIGDINPNDIKSIDILKDASATAIYGSRGANGVILVTTNKGTRGQKAQVTYNGYYGIRDIFAKYDMMDGPTFAKMREYIGYGNSTDETATNTDWQDLFIEAGMVTSHDIGISGGGENSAYNFSAGYYNDKAVVPIEQYTRISLRGSLDLEIGKYFRFGFVTNNNYNVTESPSTGSMYSVLQATPLVDPYNPDGTWKTRFNMPEDANQWTYTRDIVEANKDRMLSQTKGFGSYNNIYGEVKVPWVEGLKYRLNLGLNFRTTTGGSYTGQGINSSSDGVLSSASINNSWTTNWAIENLIIYDRTFAEKHQVNAVALYSAEQTMYNRSQVSARGVPEHFQWYNLGQTSEPFEISPDRYTQGYEKSGLMSWMGRVMYSYDNRYMLSLTARADASSRLAPGYQWHTYPAVSAGWNIRNESFMQNVDWLNSLKIRVGYGETSNQAVQPYRTLGFLDTRPYNFGDDVFDTGYYVSELPNNNLGWEYSTTWNYGLDFSLFKNRLSGTFEYYVTNTKDLLLQVDLPYTSGVNNYMANVGKTQNKGFELSLNGVILDNHNGWTWSAGINLYTNKNKIVELASGEKQNIGNAWFVGSPLNVIYGPKYIGLWQATDDQDVFKKLEPQGNVGMIKIEYLGDYDDNGIPTREMDGGGLDRQIIEVDPDFQGGFDTRVGYKGFDLTIVGAFKSGGILVSSLYSANSYLNMLNGRRGQINVDYWTEENTGAKYPKPGGISDNNNPKYLSTLSRFDASYLKIRAITLGYTFNQQAIKNLGIQNLRVYATVQNPFVLFSPYNNETGMDPETNSYGNEYQATGAVVASRIPIIGTNTPSTRNYLFGINLTF